MLLVNNNTNRIPYLSTFAQEKLANAFKVNSNGEGPEDAAKRLKDHGLDVEVIEDAGNQLVWVVGGEGPRNEHGGWDKWYFMVTPQDPQDNRWIAQTYLDRDYELYPGLENAIHHVLSMFRRA